MKILYNDNDEKEMKAMMGFEPAHNGKRMDFLLMPTLRLRAKCTCTHADNKNHI